MIVLWDYTKHLLCKTTLPKLKAILPNTYSHKQRDRKNKDKEKYVSNQRTKQILVKDVKK